MTHLLHRIAASTLVGVTLCQAPARGAPIDEFRISDIEQKIRDLETASREQARLIGELQQQMKSDRQTTKPSSSGAPSAINVGEQRWLSFANWQKVKPGMSELQVIELLGAPTQLRSSDDRSSRTLLYAMEIGRSGFLSGKVVVVAGQTTVVDTPSLK